MSSDYVPLNERESLPDDSLRTVTDQSKSFHPDQDISVLRWFFLTEQNRAFAIYVSYMENHPWMLMSFFFSVLLLLLQVFLEYWGTTASEVIIAVIAVGQTVFVLLDLHSLALTMLGGGGRREGAERNFIRGHLTVQVLVDLYFSVSISLASMFLAVHSLWPDAFIGVPDSSPFRQAFRWIYVAVLAKQGGIGAYQPSPHTAGGFVAELVVTFSIMVYQFYAIFAVGASIAAISKCSDARSAVPSRQ